MTMDRRTALALLGLGVVSPRPQAAEGYRLQFFTPQENALLDRLSEMISSRPTSIPAARAKPGSVTTSIWR